MRLLATSTGITSAPSHAQNEPQRRGWLKRFGALLGGSLLAGKALGETRGVASTQSYEPHLGEIAIFGFNFVPNGWAACNGQLLSVSENTALFSLLGTTYGGNGQTTFALPNLAGRFPLGFGQSFSGASHVQGEMAGTETVTLTTSQMPAHTHSMTATTVAGNTNNPNGALLANDGAGGAQFSTAGTSDVTMQSTSIGPAGGNQPQHTMPPYLALNFCIALQGVYPSRG